MGQYEYLESYFMIMIFWKLCPVGVSDLLLECDYSQRCVNFINQILIFKKTGLSNGHNFQNILILKDDYILSFYQSQTIKV